MYPAKFDYHRAPTVDDAVALLQQHPGASLLAGGHSLIPSMKLRLAQPATLVDLGAIADLRGIGAAEEGGLSIGAMTTYAEIAADERARAFGALHDAVSIIGDVQVRNRGTIGGNLAHNDPASDLPAVALALDATLHVVGPDGQRNVGAGDFIVGLFETSLAPNELVASVSFPAVAANSGSAYAKFENPASGYAICGIAAWLELGDDGAIRAARVAVNGALDHAQRLSRVEEALAGASGDDESLSRAASRAAEGFSDWDFMADIHADGAYRAHLMRVMTGRAVRKALERARNG